MRARCLTPTCRDYPDYGGRGIKVCGGWSSFLSFLADMGEAPAGMTLNRIDNDGDYAPENCEWATPMQQANNRRSSTRVVFQGRTQTVMQWSREMGINRRTISARLRLGWPVERALTQPPSG